MKTGILVHGYNLYTPNWEEVVWGQPPDRLGRVPRAVLVAHHFGVDIMVFGTGASERDGKKEGEWILYNAIRRFHELNAFSAFNGIDLPELKQKIWTVALPECKSQNTHQETLEAAKIFIAHGAERVFLVSSPDHVPRCYRNANAALTQLGALDLRRQLYVTGSDILYKPDRPIENVEIKE